MSARLAWLRDARVITLAALAVAWLAWQGWLSLEAPGKIGEGFPADRARVNVRIWLPFAPERFHVQAFQKFGRVSGTEEHTVDVRGVRRDDLRSIARLYWVSRVAPLPEEP